jgi:hypothetical protein
MSIKEADPKKKRRERTNSLLHKTILLYLLILNPNIIGNVAESITGVATLGAVLDVAVPTGFFVFLLRYGFIALFGVEEYAGSIAVRTTAKYYLTLDYLLQIFVF